MSHTGAQFGEIAQFLLRKVDLPEQRIGKNFVQFGKEAVLVGGGKIAQIEVIGLRQAEQDLRRHRALVPLYQVDIARGNTKPFGDLGLRQAELLADAAEAGPDEQFFSGIGGHGSLSLLSFRGVQSTNPESRDSGSAVSGMTSNSVTSFTKLH